MTSEAENSGMIAVRIALSVREAYEDTAASEDNAWPISGDALRIFNRPGYTTRWSQKRLDKEMRLNP